MPAPDAIACKKPSKLIGLPRCPAILDLRRDEARAAVARHLPAARPLAEAEIAPEALERLAAERRGRPVVVVRAEGRRLSQGAAAWLRPPEAARLLAASLRLSRMGANDLDQLEAGTGLCDAFHRWSRDATAETHDRPAPRAGGAR